MTVRRSNKYTAVQSFLLTCAVGVPCLLFTDALGYADGHESVVYTTYSGNFELWGTAIDRRSREPIEGVSVLVKDTGLDHVHQIEQDTIFQGQQDREGTISSTFQYGWCTKTLTSKSLRELAQEQRSSGTFSVELSKNGYQTYMKEFDIRDLRMHEKTFIVDLGLVELVPIEI